MVGYGLQPVYECRNTVEAGKLQPASASAPTPALMPPRRR
jgi:hypothetical protein